MLRDARKGVLPEEFMKSEPELSNLIISMVSSNDLERPNS